MSDLHNSTVETLSSPASIKTPFFIQNTKNKEIYNYQQVLGHGSYGTVYLASEVRGGKNYALKKFINPFLSLQRAVTTYRELYFAQHFNHPNLVHYKSIFFDDRENPKDIYALYDFMDMDLRYVLNSQQPLTLYHIQFFIYHLLCGVKYMHTAGVMHRDIKPENILINSNCQLKLGDYGMSRVHFPTQFSNYICSRWYRAPEILFSIDYTESVDIWAVGCILAELLIKRVLFPGKSTNHQLQLISELLGPPNSGSNGVCNVNNLKIKNDNWNETFEGCDPVALNLLQSLLVWNYTKRPTASQALRHPFFFKVFCPSCEKAAPFKLLVPVIKNYKIDEIVNNMPGSVPQMTPDGSPSGFPSSIKKTSTLVLCGEVERGNVRRPTHHKSQQTAFDKLGLGTVIAQRFVIESSVGSGSFGENKTTDNKVALKCEQMNISRPQLRGEAKFLTNLKGCKGFTNVLWSGSELGYNFLAMDLLGESLDSLFEKNNKKFSLKTVLLLVDQMLTRIEDLHERDYIHRDLKPENWMMGLGTNSDLLYLIDFGLSKSYRNQRTHQHIPFREDCSLTGTARYCSINAHHSEQSRRDDLESLGYILIYFLKGHLPWQGISRGVATSHMSIIEQTKINTSVDSLCSDLPVEFKKYIEYCRSLEFQTKPDYKYLRRMFQKLALKNGYKYDDIYDWSESGKKPVTHPSINNMLQTLPVMTSNQNNNNNNNNNADNNNNNNSDGNEGNQPFDEDELCDKCPLCLWRTPENVSENNTQDTEQYFPLHEGIIGSNRDKATITIDGIEDSHARLTWDQVKGAYCLQDNRSETGTFLLLSSERRCRDTIELKKGDKFYISQGVEVEVLHIDYATITLPEEIIYKMHPTSYQYNSNECSFNPSSAPKNCGKTKPHIRFNSEINDSDGNKMELHEEEEIIENVQYHLSAKLAVRVGKTFNDESEIIQAQIIDVTREVTLGSLSTNAVQLPDECAGVHCKISVLNDKLLLKDLAVGDPGGTKLFLSRPIELFERDIIVFGESIELGVMPVADSPVLECVWEECAVRLTPIRKSKRTPIYSKEAQMDKTIIFRVPKDGEVIIGRSEDNHIHFPDYKLSDRHACMYFEPLEKKFYLESLVMSRSQITELLLGRATSSTKSPYKLNKDDVFCISGSQFQVIGMKVETKEEVEKREQLAFDRAEKLWKDVSLLSLLPKEIFTKVADALKPVTFSEGEYLLQQGEIGTIFYIIKKGKVDIIYTSKGEKTLLKTCGPNDALGELSIINGTTYSASAIATTETVECMALDSVSFLNYVGPYIGTIGEAARKRDMDTYVDLLSQLNFFNTLPHDEIVKIANVCHPKTFHDKEYLTKEGETGQNLDFYIIISGQVRITKSIDLENTITMLSNGDYLGEKALLTGNPRNANAIAVGLVETLSLERSDFELYLKDHLLKYLGENDVNNDVNNNQNNGLDGNGMMKDMSKPNINSFTQQLKTRRLSEQKPLEIQQPVIKPAVRNTLANIAEDPEEEDEDENGGGGGGGMGGNGEDDEEVDHASNPSYFSDEELQIESENDIEIFESLSGLKKSHYIILKVLSGPLRQAIYVMEGDLITIGTGVCTISINDSSLNSLHCSIEYRENGYWLSDSDSDSGTFLQLGLGLAFPVQVGDSFRLGNTELTILGKTKTIEKSTVIQEPPPRSQNSVINIPPIYTPGPCCSTM